MVNSQKIIELLTKRNMTQEELAMKVGVSKTMMNFIVRGIRQPTVQTLTNIAEVFGVSVDKLILKN